MNSQFPDTTFLAEVLRLVRDYAAKVPSDERIERFLDLLAAPDAPSMIEQLLAGNQEESTFPQELRIVMTPEQDAIFSPDFSSSSVE